MSKAEKNIRINHRFLDEAGDTAFYGKGKKAIIGTEGVSGCFIIGMVKIKEPIESLRKRISQLQDQISNETYFQVPSILKKKKRAGYYFHATDDLPEVRKIFFDLIKETKCSFEAVVGRKSIERYETVHKGKEEYFYADLLSHLLKNKISGTEKLILNIAERGRSTKNNNLMLALEKAKERVAENKNKKHLASVTAIAVTRHDIKTNVAFNVLYPTQEPLLNVTDYFCWAVQRVFEKGEMRFYDHIKQQVSLVVDLYDKENYEGWRNYYTPKNPLTIKNKISPPLH